MKQPSLFPFYDAETKTLSDGVVEATSFCKRAHNSRPECIAFYSALTFKPPGFYQCPFGYTARTFYFEGKLRVLTGVVAHPRFGTEQERAVAKKFPSVKVSRIAMDSQVAVLESIDARRSALAQEASRVFPQAFHELRKLNAAVLQNAERHMALVGETPALLTIKGAAELMRNNFDILEALSNIEGMRALPADATINLYDLAYKTMFILAEKARSKQMTINISGVRAIVRGSQKSFPIVPAVLFENAIKYGRPGEVTAIIAASKNRVTFSVHNHMDGYIEPVKCFEKGTRYAAEVAEGGGFGLYLAKEIVAAHGGTIRCDFMPGSVTFVVELPLKEVMK